MQIEVKVEELRKKKIFVATPMYGGQCFGMYTKACIDLATLCANYGIECKFFFIFNESLITRARNYLVDLIHFCLIWKIYSNTILNDLRQRY